MAEPTSEPAAEQLTVLRALAEGTVGRSPGGQGATSESVHARIRTHSTPNAGYISTANPDPRRPTCIWINADYGSAQIQNFDAFTGGACGQGAIRVLSSQFIVPQVKCNPSAYRKFEILQPALADYTDGTRSGSRTPAATRFLASRTS